MVPALLNWTAAVAYDAVMPSPATTPLSVPSSAGLASPYVLDLLLAVTERLALLTVSVCALDVAALPSVSVAVAVTVSPAATVGVYVYDHVLKLVPVFVTASTLTRVVAPF